MKKIKGFNLTSGVFDIILASIAIGFGALMGVACLFIGSLFVSLTGIILPIGAFMGLVYQVAAAIIIVVFALLAVLYMIAGVKTVKANKLEGTEYSKKKAMFLTFAILETIVAILSFLLLIEGFSIGTLAIGLICLLFVSFRWAAFGLMVKRDKKLEKIKSEGAPAIEPITSEPVTTEEPIATPIDNSNTEA